MPDAEKYLQQIERLDAQIEIKLEEKTRLKEMALKTTSAPKEIPFSSGGKQDQFTDIMAKIGDLETEIDRLVDRRADIVGTIQSVENTNQMKTLYKHYAQGKNLRQVASEIDKSYRQTCYIHRAGLATISKIIGRKD